MQYTPPTESTHTPVQPVVLKLLHLAATGEIARARLPYKHNIIKYTDAARILGILSYNVYSVPACQPLQYHRDGSMRISPLGGTI